MPASSQADIPRRGWCPYVQTYYGVRWQAKRGTALAGREEARSRNARGSRTPSGAGPSPPMRKQHCSSTGVAPFRRARSVPSRPRLMEPEAWEHVSNAWTMCVEYRPMVGHHASQRSPSKRSQQATRCHRAANHAVTPFTNAAIQRSRRTTHPARARAGSFDNPIAAWQPAPSRLVDRQARSGGLQGGE